MDDERLEQKLRDYFKTEVQGLVPPGEWWDREIYRLDERKSYSLWHSLLPKTRLAWVLLPVILLLLGGTMYGAGSLIQDALSRYTGTQTPGPGVHYIPTGEIYFDELPDIISPFGESVEMKITFTNYDAETRIMLNYPPRVTIESRNLSFEHRTVRSFPPDQEQLQLQPGETKEYLLVWDQKDDNGQQVPYGWYEIRTMVQSYRITDTKTTQGASGRVTRILVIPLSGVMEKTFEVNQSQTVNGVTVNLEKIELKAQKANVYTFTASSDYAPENFSTLYISTDAEYKVDNENWKPALKESFGTIGLEDGVRHIWDLDPVAQNSEELILRINRINDWEGPWEFKVPLQQPGNFR
jgi:hypothetical protein